MRRGLVTVALLLFSTVPPVYAQNPPKQSSGESTKTRTSQAAGTSTQKPAASASPSAAKPQEPKVSVKGWKTYCSEEGAYCISYPPDWNVAGDVFEGTGVVMAPPQDGKEKSQWNEVTSSVAYLPETEDKEPPTFDEILTVALKDLPGRNVQTLQRTELTIAKRPAQLAKVKYDDQNSGKPWIEEIVFIDDGDAIYSTALRSSPEDLEKLEPVFRTIVATWRPSEEAPAVPAPPAAPKKPKTATPPKPGAESSSKPTKVTPH